MEKRLTKFTLSSQGESITISFAYSVIDASGNIIDQNKRGSMVLTSAMEKEKEAYNTLKVAIMAHIND